MLCHGCPGRVHAAVVVTEHDASRERERKARLERDRKWDMERHACLWPQVPRVLERQGRPVTARPTGRAKKAEAI